MGREDTGFDELRLRELQKIDLQLVLRTTDYNRFQEKMRKGTAQLYYWGWNADYPDPENFLFLFYGPQGKAKFSGENASNFADVEFDRLFERMRAMENGPEREMLVDQLVGQHLSEHAGYHGTMVWVLMMMEQWFKQHEQA